MYEPAEHDEITSLLRYLEQQLDALRASALGLTEAQSRESPCRSSLSIAGLLKHAIYVMRGATARLGGSVPTFDADRIAAYMASFAPTDDETTESLLSAFDAARAEYLAAFSSADPDARAVEPPAPCQGRMDERPIRLRYFLTHQIEEIARHAGHADIIREQLDGVSVPALVMTREGAAATEFFQPIVPAPGTIGAR
jgi:uncharacterized damage-inducible protein DinB